jgi:hypothetical protein
MKEDGGEVLSWSGLVDTLTHSSKTTSRTRRSTATTTDRRRRIEEQAEVDFDPKKHIRDLEHLVVLYQGQIRELKDDAELLKRHMSLEGLLLGEEREKDRRIRSTPRGELGPTRQVFPDGLSSKIESVERRVQEKMKRDRDELKREAKRVGVARVTGSTRFRRAAPLQETTGQQSNRPSRDDAGTVESRIQRRRASSSSTL